MTINKETIEFLKNTKRRIKKIFITLGLVVIEKYWKWFYFYFTITKKANMTVNKETIEFKKKYQTGE